MGYHVVRAGEHSYEERPKPEGREQRPGPPRLRHLTTAAELRQSRARLWRYPPGTRGRRHADLAQEEVFVVLSGTLTMHLGEPPERVELRPQSVVAVEPGTRAPAAQRRARRRSSSSSTARRPFRRAPTSSRTRSPEQPQAAAATRPARSKTSSPSSASTRIVSPSSNSPSSSRSASGFSTMRWIARFSGRAPYVGSHPASATTSFAASVSSSARERSASRSRSRASWSSTIAPSCSRAERVELDDLVDPVQELRPEELAQRLGGADVRGHHDHRVPEVDRAALAVGQPAVVQDLEQHVEDLRVRLLDLVEQDDRVRAAADRLGELAALVVADVPGRRADQARDRVPLLVLGHVQPDHRPLVVEHELRERAGELRLPDAGRAEEDERADRPVRVLEPRAGAAECVRDRRDRLVLADDALVQPLLHVDQLLRLALEQPVDRDPRPARDDGADVVLVDLLLDHGRRRPAPAAPRAPARAPGSSP